jgi:hypothetical protein
VHSQSSSYENPINTRRYSRKLLECDASWRLCDPSHRLQKKSGGHSRTAALKLSILPEQEFYDDLYLTEQPYGLVSGVLTDLPAND